jgi:hypothetical protein
MDERHGTDEAQGRWTQVDIGEVALGHDVDGRADGLKVFLWRRIPTPVPPRMTEADYRLGVVLEYQSEQLGFSADDAERLADELPALLKAAAARARQG